MALAVSFPTGVISTAKALLLAGGALLLLADMAGVRRFHASRSRHTTSVAVLMALTGLAISTLWTTAPLDEAAHAWVKHAKLAVIPLLIALIQTRAEARKVLICYLAGQCLVLVLSWLSVLHVPLPFYTQATPGRDFLVFAGHLDQPIMTGLATAVFWHLRAELGLTGRRGTGLALAVAVLAMVNVLLLQIGRTGHLVSIALVGAAVFWSIPRRIKWVAVFSPILAAGLIVAVSPQIQSRMAIAYQEAANYESSGDIESSMGERLNYWRRSLQAIRERPVAGFGVGSWNMQYNRLEGGKGRLHTWNIRNPHQEFLLWMVEAGILGMLMIGAVFGAAIKDSLRMHTAAQRAAQSAVLAIGVSCLFNASLYDAQVGDYLCVALAIVLAFGLRSEATASANGTLQAP